MKVPEAKKLLLALHQHFDQKKAVLPQICELFAPNTMGTSALLRKSLIGRLSAIFKRPERRSVQDEKVKQIFLEAITVLQKDSKAWQKIPLSTRLAVHQAFQTRHKSDIKIPLSPETAQLQQIAQQKQKEQEEALRKASFLRCQCTPDSQPLDRQTFSNLFTDREELSLQAFRYLEQFLSKKSDVDPKELVEKAELIQQGRKLRKRLQADLLPRGKTLTPPEREIRMNAHAEKLSKAVLEMTPNKHWMFCGGYGQKLASLTLLLRLYKFLPESTQGSLPAPVQSLLKQDSLPHPKDFVKENVHKAVQELQKQCPELGKFLDEPMLKAFFEEDGRELPEKLKRWMPQFIADHLETWMHEGLIKQILLLVPEGGASQFLLWLSENGHRVTTQQGREDFIKDVEKRIVSYTEQHFDETTEWMDEAINKLYKNIRKTFPDTFLKAASFDSLLDAGSCWLDFEKQKNGKYTISIYSTGSALSFHEKDEKTGKINWPKRLYNIDPGKLNTQFFRRILHHAFEPQCNPKAISSAENLYNGVLKYLGGSQRFFSAPKDEWRRIPTCPVSDLHLAEALMTKPKKERPDGIILLEMRLQALSQFCQPFLQGQEKALVLENLDAAKLIERAMETIYEQALQMKNELTSPFFDRIEATRTEIFAALKEFRAEAAAKEIAANGQIVSRKLPLPSVLVQGMRSMLEGSGLTIEDIKKSKETLCWAFGEEIGEVVDEITDSLQGNAPVIGKKKEILNKPLRKGELHAFFTNIYVTVAISALKAGMFIAAVLESPYAYLLIIPGVDSALRRILPHPFYDWYTNVIDGLLFALKKLAVTLLLRILFEKKDIKHLEGQIKEWQQRVQAWSRSLTDKQIMAYQLDKPMRKQESLIPFTCEVKGLELDQKVHANGKIQLEECFRTLRLPRKAPQTHEELLSTLTLLSEEMKKDHLHGHRATLRYFVNIMGQLQIPQLGKGNLTLWDTLPNPEEALELLSNIGLAFHRQSSWVFGSSGITEVEMTEAVMSSYHVYSIMDRLARRCSDANLDDYRTNAFPLLYFINSPGVCFDDPRKLGRMQEICHYFMPEIDIDDLPADLSKDVRIQKMMQSCLFDYTLFESSDSEDLPEIKYYKEQLKKPGMDEKLKEIGVAPKASEHAKIASLFVESTVFTREKSLLPRAFCLLKLQSCLVNKSICTTNSSWAPFGFKEHSPPRKEQYNEITRGSCMDLFLPSRLACRMLQASEQVLHSFHTYLTSIVSPSNFWNISANSITLARTQSEVMIPRSFNLDRDHFVNRELQKEFELILCERADSIVRAIGFLRKYKSKLFASPFLERNFQAIFFRFGDLKQQLAASPVTAKAIAEFIHEFFQFHHEQKHYTECLWILNLGVKLRRFVAEFAPQYLADFPDLAGMLKQITDERPKDVFGKSLVLSSILIPENFDQCNQKERPAAVMALCRCLFHPMKKSYKPGEETYEDINQDAFCKENSDFKQKFLQWTPEILLQLDNPDFRFTLLKTIAEDHHIKLPNENEAKWKKNGVWAWNYGNLKIDFYSGTLKFDEASVSGLDELNHIKNLTQGMSPATHQLKCVGPGIFETPDKSLRVESDPADPKKLACFKVVEGKKFRYVSERIPEELKNHIPIDSLNPVFCWIEETAKEEKIMRIEPRKGSPVHFKILYSLEQAKPPYHKKAGSHITQIKPPPNYKIISQLRGQNELLICKGSEFQYLLAPIARFCSLDQITCWITKNQSRLQRIDIDREGLSFEVSEQNGELRAIEKSRFPNFYIAPKQTEPAMKGFASYLLLQNDNNHKKALVSTGQLVSSGAMRLLPMLGLEGPLRNLLEQYLSNLNAPASGFYAYDIDPSGTLQSDKPEELAYIMMLYLLQGEHSKALQACHQLELMCKLQPIDQSIIRFLLPLAFIPSNIEEFGLVRRRLLSALEENRLTHPYRLYTTYDSNDLAFALIAMMDLYQMQEHPDPRRDLTETQEWFLYQSVFARLEGVIKHFLGDGIDLGPALKTAGWDGAMRLAGLPPKLIQRYQFLRNKFGKDISLFGKGMRFVAKVIATPSGLTPYAFLPKALKTNYTDLMKDSIELINHGGTYMISNSYKYAFRWKLEMISAIIGAPPLTVHSINSEKLKVFFLSYYAIAKGECGKEKKRHLAELLQLIKGGWDLESQLLLRYLEAVMRFPKIFPAPKALQEALFSGWQVEKRYPFADFFDLLDRRSVLVNQSQTMVRIGKNLFGPLLISQYAIPKLFGYAAGALGSSILNWAGSRTVFWGDKFIRASISSIPEEKNIEVSMPKPSVEHETPYYDFLEHEDKKIDTIFSGLFKIAFEERPKEQDSKKDHIKRFDTTGLNKATRARVERVNQSLKDYYSRQDRIPQTYRLKNSETLWELYIKLSEERDSLKELVDQEHAALMATVNPPSLSLRHPVTFDDLKRFLLKGSLGELGHEIGFKAQDLKFLETAIIRNIAKHTRLKQMERALKHFEALAQMDPEKDKPHYQERLELLVKELRARRTYKFADLPPKLLRRFMLFELLTNKMLWKKQVKAMERLLLGSQGDAVIELLMSFGKTDFGIPTIDSFEADGKQIIFNIWPEAVAGANMRHISKQGHQVFGQTAHALPLRRQDKLKAENFAAINAVLQGARTKGDTINMTKQEAQAAELIFLDHLYNYVNNFSGNKENLEDLLGQVKKLLCTMRSTGKVIGDEAHEIFPPKDELNYPIGQSKIIKESLFEVTEASMRWLTEDPKLMRLIIDMDLQSVSKEEYQKRIAPALAEKLSGYPIFELKNISQKHELLDFILGKTKISKGKGIPEWILKHEHYGEISMAKGLLTVILPLIFARTVHVNYGPSGLKGNGDYARPYEGNNSPLESSTIRSPYEALVKTFVMYLCRGITIEQSRDLIKKLQESVQIEKRSRSVDACETKAYKNFSKIFPKIDLMSIQPDQPQESKILEAMMRNNEAIFCYIRYCVLSQIRYWRRNIRSDAHNFDSQFKSKIYDTGTPYNNESYPSNLKMLWDPGTIGEALDIISKKCPPNGISLLRNIQPRDILREVLHTYFKPGGDFTAIIDGGALLKGLDNEWVAKEMLAHCKKHRLDIRAIVFFKKDSQGKDQLMCFENGAKEPILLDRCHVPLHQRLTYFDQRHGFAADVPQKANGKGINLVGEPTLQRLMQEVFRFRGIKKFKKLFGTDRSKTINESDPQQIYFAMTEETAAKISLDRKPSLRDLITYAIKNEAEQVAESNYHSYRQKIANIVRRAILDKVEFAPTIEDVAAIFREFEHYLVPFTEDDPKKLYGLLDAYVPAKQALDAVKENAFSVIKNSHTFSEEEKGQIKKKFDELFMPPMPKLVHVYADGNGIHTNVLDDLEREVGQEVEQDQQKENDLNRETELQSQHEGWFVQKPFKESPWASSVKPHTLDWLKIESIPKKVKPKASCLSRWKSVRPPKHPPFFSFQEALKNSSTKDLRLISDVVDKRLWFTNNFVPYLVNGAFQRQSEVGDENQRELFEILVFVKKERNQYRVMSMGALTEKEAGVWRKKLKEDPESKTGVYTLVYDIQSRTSVAGSAINIDLLKNDKDFKLLESQLKFLNGDDTYREQKDVLKEWVQSSRLKAMRKAFSHIRGQRKTTSMEGTDIDVILNTNRIK